MFRYFKEKKQRKSLAKTRYDKAVQIARSPVFYNKFHVPDTIDGRFEAISLHVYIVIHRLTSQGKKHEAQALFDAFFVNMDRSLREIGIGDLGVPKHMKRMMQGFNGRCQHYEAALLDKDKLIDALSRNLYGTVDHKPSVALLSTLADYIQIACQNQDIDAPFPLEILEEEERIRA